MTAIVEPPQPLPTPIPQPAPLLEELKEGEPPRIRIQKPRKPENLKDIQASPLFSGGES
jgi:hypothetical protein